MAVDQHILEWWGPFVLSIQGHFKNIISLEVVDWNRLIQNVKLFLIPQRIGRVTFFACHDTFRVWWLWCRLSRNSLTIMLDLPRRPISPLILHPRAFKIRIDHELRIALRLECICWPISLYSPKIPAFFNLRKIRSWFPPYHNLFFFHHRFISLSLFNWYFIYMHHNYSV